MQKCIVFILSGRKELSVFFLLPKHFNCLEIRFVSDVGGGMTYNLHQSDIVTLFVFFQNMEQGMKR